MKNVQYSKNLNKSPVQGNIYKNTCINNNFCKILYHHYKISLYIGLYVLQILDIY